MQMDLPLQLKRSFTFERSDINEEKRTVTLSFSSEFPVERRNGMEVLSHRAGDFNFSFLNSDAPLLLNHDDQRQIGKIVSAWVQDGRGMAEVLLSRSQQGQEVLQDVIDGIRHKVSVGYFASDPVLERSDNDTPVYRYKWTPTEISFVPRPADPSVGVGRDADPNIEIQIPHEEVTQTHERNQKMELENTKIDDVITSIETETRSADTVETFTRGAPVADIEKLCRHFNLESEIDGLVERSATIDEAKAHIQAKWKEASKATRSIAAPVFIKDLNQERSFNMGKAIKAAATQDWNQAGFEREMSQERAKTSSRAWDRNVLVLDPNANTGSRAALTGNAAGTANYGSQLVGTEYRPDRLIDAVWNKTFLDKVGADQFLGLQQNQSIPVISSNATSSWVAETGALPSEQRLTTGSKSLSPKELVSKFAYSRQLLLQGLPNIEEKVLGQLYNSIGQALDAAAISNSGVTLSTSGLLNDVTNVVAMGATGAAPTLKSFYDLRKLLVNGAIDVEQAKFVISASLNETLHTTLKDSANTNSGYILAEAQSTLAGLPVIWSQNVPSDLTKSTGSNLSAAILGKWDDFAVAQWGNIAVEFDPISAADYSQMVIRSYSFWDMAIKRLSSFAVVKDYVA